MIKVIIFSLALMLFQPQTAFAQNPNSPFPVCFEYEAAIQITKGMGLTRYMTYRSLENKNYFELYITKDEKELLVVLVTENDGKLVGCFVDNWIGLKFKPSI